MAIAALLLMAPLVTTGQDSSRGSKTKVKSGSSSKTMTDQTPTLTQLLQETAAMGAKKFPAEMIAKMKRGVEAAREEGVEKTAKKVGDVAPDATMTNFNGQSVRLSDLWKQGPIVLMWYRGGW